MGGKKRLGSEISENVKKWRRDEEHDASIKSKLGESHMNERASQAKEISKPGFMQRMRDEYGLDNKSKAWERAKKKKP